MKSKNKPTIKLLFKVVKSKKKTININANTALGNRKMELIDIPRFGSLKKKKRKTKMIEFKKSDKKNIS